MKRFFKIFDTVLEAVIAIMFSAMTIILMGQVVARYFFNFPFMWAEEIGIYLFIWIVYLGSAIACNRKGHLAVDFLVNMLPANTRCYLQLLLHLVVMAFLFFFVFLQGLNYAGRNLSVPAFSVAYIQMGWIYASVPIGALAMVLNMARVIPTFLNEKERRKTLA